MMVDTLPEMIEETPLSSWLREYAQYAGIKNVCPSLDEIRNAVLLAFPSYIIETKQAQELLDKFDLPVIMQDEIGRIALTATTDAQAADAMLAKYSDEQYVLLRKLLVIDYLLILQVNESLGHTRNDLFEAYVEFSALPEKPDCAIISL
jgi:hypothetical protein